MPALSDDLSDAALVHAARDGEVSALGTLLLRHRPALLAVAVSMLGYGPDAEDAVQETCLAVLRSLGDLRDPSAVGPWLRAVVRNVCRKRMRSLVPVPAGDGLAALLPSEPDPTEQLERNALRDWVWHALEDLSPPLRLVVILRYFTGVTAYQDIASACGIPVGTVRSRLSDARGKLATGLLANAHAAHGDIAATASTRRREAEEMISSLGQGRFPSTARQLWAPTIEALWASGSRTTGLDYPLRSMDQDLAAGVRFRLTNVVGGSDVAIWETALINPDHDPLHCPPAAVWVQQMRDGRVTRLRILHAKRPALEENAGAGAQAM